MNIGNAIGSVTEGIGALGESVKSAIDGDGAEAGENLARFGLEAAGIAGTALTGPAAEVVQEGIEGALDNAVLERGTGDVPGPEGEGADWSIPNLLSGAVSGTAEGLGAGGGTGGAIGELLGRGGEAGGSLGKILGAAGGLEGAGGGEGGEGLGELFGAAGGGGGSEGGPGELLGAFGGDGGGGGKGLSEQMSSFGQAADLMSGLGSSEGQVADKMLSALV